MSSVPGIGTADIDTIFKALSRRLPGMISEAIEAQQQQPVLPIAGKFATGKQRGLVRRGHEGGRLSVRSGAAR